MKTALLVLFTIGDIFALPPHFQSPLPKKIVGGIEASKGEFPHIVQIQLNGEHLCSGSVVNENWIVTAAHCVENPAENYTLVAGEHDRSLNEGTEQASNLSEILIHPNYSQSNFVNDIALLRVNSSFTFNTYVSPATIANSSFTPGPTDQFTVAGWGDTSVGGSSSTTLMKVSVPLVDTVTCAAAFGGILPAEGVICAGDLEKGFCHGDSGGPLMYGSTLAGLASWTLDCGEYGYPGVYTEIANYSNWIASNTQ